MGTKTIYNGYLKLMYQRNFVNRLNDHLESLKGDEYKAFHKIWDDWCYAKTPGQKSYRKKKLMKELDKAA